MKDGVEIGKIDVDMRQYKGDTATYNVGEVKFIGVAAEQILGDKISAISGDRVFRRAIWNGSTGDRENRRAVAIRGGK